MVGDVLSSGESPTIFAPGKGQLKSGGQDGVTRKCRRGLSCPRANPSFRFYVENRGEQPLLEQPTVLHCDIWVVKGHLQVVVVVSIVWRPV